MTQVMAVEFAKFGVRVNAIAPGPIETPLTKAVHSEATRDNWRRAVALGRYGHARELCGPVSRQLDDAPSGSVPVQAFAVAAATTAERMTVPETWMEAQEAVCAYHRASRAHCVRTRETHPVTARANRQSH